MGFKSEKELFNAAMSSAYIKLLIGSYSGTVYLIEPDGLFGIPDLVIANIDTTGEAEQQIEAFAFEVKLSNWKRALIQAFRYRAFAEMSYVLIDRERVAPALSQIYRFQKANIGLISIDIFGEIIIHHQPSSDTPYCDRTRSNLEKIIMSSTVE